MFYLDLRDCFVNLNLAATVFIVWISDLFYSVNMLWIPTWKWCVIFCSYLMLIYEYKADTCSFYTFHGGQIFSLQYFDIICNIDIWEGNLKIIIYCSVNDRERKCHLSAMKQQLDNN